MEKHSRHPAAQHYLRREANSLPQGRGLGAWVWPLEGDELAHGPGLQSALALLFPLQAVGPLQAALMLQTWLPRGMVRVGPCTALASLFPLPPWSRPEFPEGRFLCAPTPGSPVSCSFTQQMSAACLGCATPTQGQDSEGNREKAPSS